MSTLANISAPIPLSKLSDLPPIACVTARFASDCDVNELTQKNSEFMKKKDKVLKAKEFREMIAINPHLELDPQTLDNFSKLFSASILKADRFV